MTKKEQAKLHSEKCIIEAVDVQLGHGLGRRYLIGMSLTRGELLALHSVLAENNEAYTVSSDLFAFLNNALERAGIKI